MTRNSSTPAPAPVESSDVPFVEASPAYKPGDMVMVNSLIATITSWPDSGAGFFTFNVDHVNGSVDRHTEHTATVSIERVPELA